MASLVSTRRGILGAIAIAPVAIAVPAASAATMTSSGFPDLHAAYRAAQRAALDFDKAVYVPAMDRYERLVEAIPHATVEWDGGRHAAAERWTTSDWRQVKEARYFLDPKHTRPVRPEQTAYHTACLQLVAADDARLTEWQKAHIASGLQAAEIRSDELLDARCDARDAMIHCSVRSASELALKIAVINEDDLWDDERVRRTVSDDVNRIAGHES